MLSRRPCLCQALILLKCDQANHNKKANAILTDAPYMIKYELWRGELLVTPFSSNVFTSANRLEIRPRTCWVLICLWYVLFITFYYVDLYMRFANEGQERFSQIQIQSHDIAHANMFG